LQDELLFLFAVLQSAAQGWLADSQKTRGNGLVIASAGQGFIDEQLAGLVQGGQGVDPGEQAFVGGWAVFTGKSLICETGFRSPVSPRNRVPPADFFTNPSRLASAPVKTPFLCPNNTSKLIPRCSRRGAH